MPRDDKGRFIKESRQKQREGLARGREKSKARKSGTVNISETPEEALVGIDHNYFDGDNGGDDTCQIAKEVVLSQEDEEKKDQWRMGRRVVDLGIIADGLKSCQLCGQPLHLSNCVSERKFGLAHVLIVKCNFPECGLLNEVPTGRKHKTTSGGYAWDVNTKLAAAMINEGLGETQVNGLLASLNIPTITQKSLKEREREVGNQLDLMAEESCRQHLRREIEMSEGNLSASFDGAWQKRGTGRAYNSLTGHASLFGEKTKKLIGYSVMAKKCRICAAAKVKGVPPRKHKCRVNWTGSAKAMEPAMACQMLKNVEDEGVKVTTLIMDNDSTTLSRVKASVNPNISKKSDSNHTKKGFTGSLIELSNQHKVLRNVKVRGHIERCFMYCIHQNQNREQQLKADFRNIVSHLYGEHHGCGSWCKSEKSNYKPRNLPYGKPLSCPILRKALEDLFEKYANKASELSALGSTQLNESFNQMVSSKAPKRLYFGGSESLHSRISATVCQKNDGYSYVSELNKKLTLSPGHFTIKHTVRLANKLKKKRLSQCQRSVKRRRLELKGQRLSKDASQSVLEGATYSSEIGLENEDVDLQDIDLNPLNVSPESSSLLYVDLETTGLQRTSDILQIAAVSADQTFNVYMTPNRAIAEDASRATGLTYEGGVLKHHGQPLDAVEPARGLEQFVNFVRSLSKPFVIGHNIQNFDIPVLMFHLQKCNLMHVFQDSVSGFIDTYRLSKKVIDKATVCNYKQETLVKCLLGVDYEAHNALSDVTSLRKLYEEKLSKHCNSSDVFTLSYYSVKASLEPLVQKKVISALISKRLINCSLSLNKLKLIHKRDPQNGLRNVFSEPMSSSKTPRISKSKNVINKVVEFMKTL